MRYDAILLDTLNMLYRLKEKNEQASVLSTKYVFRGLAAKYLETVKSLRENYLAEGGTFYLLFDNPTSRLDLQKSFYFASRKHIYPKYKEQRSKECKEFYNTLDLIRYYYLTSDSSYACIQVQNLEADDLVKPVLTNYCKDPVRSLMVTNDYDWTRYLSERVDWLPNLGEGPETFAAFTEKMGFMPTENSVIIYKSLFGDPSDNIPSILPKNNKNYLEFLDFLREDPALDPEMLIMRGHNTAALNKSAVLKAVKANERQYRINIQLTATIPVAEKHLLAVTSKGRDSKVITDAVEIALGLKKEKKEFVFGNIKSPKSC